MISDSGTRVITDEDRAVAIKQELINSTSRLNITPGMWRAIKAAPAAPRKLRTRRWWWPQPSSLLRRQRA